MFLPPLLSSQGIALVSPPTAQVGVIRDTTSGFLHPSGKREDTYTRTLWSLNTLGRHSRVASPSLGGRVHLDSGTLALMGSVTGT